MVNYGSLEYWNERYAGDDEEDEGFDWLCDYEGVKESLDYLLPDKSTQLLMIGCGNAPFSPDLYNAGYTNLINIDLSDVVINLMKKRFPHMHWEIMDVLNMKYEDGTIPSILDKSLIDTLMCYTNSAVKTIEMLKEIYRVLQTGGRYVTFSLHALDEVKAYFDRLPELDWRVRYYRVKSNRWNDKENLDRAVVYTMVVCDKRPTNCPDEAMENVPGTLSDEQYLVLEKMVEDVRLRRKIEKADLSVLMHSLDEALSNVLSKRQGGGSSTKDEENHENQEQEKGREQASAAEL